MSNIEQKALMEFQFLKGQFINDITFSGMMLGLEMSPILKRRPDGGIIPAFKMMKMKKRPGPAEIASARQLYWERKQSQLKELHWKDGMIKESEAIIKLAANRPAWRKKHAYWATYKALEAEHKLSLKPVIMAYPDGIFASYDVVKK